MWLALHRRIRAGDADEAARTDARRTPRPMDSIIRTIRASARDIR
jgi:hypothetical protein